MIDSYTWAPGIEWKIQKDGKVKIGRYVYPATCQIFFPDLYFAAQEFIVEEDLILLFEEDSHKIARSFIKDLIKKQVLISGVMSPVDLFLTQQKLYVHSFSEDDFLDPAKVEKYKVDQLDRCFSDKTKGEYQLLPSEEILPIFMNRKSHRSFDRRPISYEVFSNIFSVLSQHQKNGNISYLYPSAGGLYPIDVFVYVKSNRVDKLDHGLYYYFPKENTLRKVSDNQLTDNVHFSINKDIFNSSAFSVYFIYNAASSMPKYGGMGYFYACIDTGIMVSTFNTLCEKNGIGACSIGEMNYKKIKEYLSLNSDQILLHCMECGMKEVDDE